MFDPSMKGTNLRKFPMNSEKTNEQNQLDELADRSGLALVFVDENSSVLSESNNNSMCRILYNSPEFARSCAEFCGKAFRRATEAEESIEYKCYAGLNYMAVPLKKRKSVAIVGRVFLKAEDYRAATERAAVGDWKRFPASEFFENALVSGSPEILSKTAREIQNLEIGARRAAAGSQSSAAAEISVSDEQLSSVENQESIGEAQTAAPRSESSKTQPSSRVARRKSQEWRSLFGSLLDLDYKKACRAVAEFVKQKYAVTGLAWLERHEDRLETVFAEGDLQNREMRLNVAAGDAYLLDALQREMPLELRERQNAGETSAPQTIQLFPMAVGGAVQSALVVGDPMEDGETKRQIAKFCQKIASQIEILRLREQLSRRRLVERAVEKFNESLKNIDSEDFWSHLMNASAELMRSERSSLLIFDEKAGALVAKAATGSRADFIKTEQTDLGRRVAKNVLKGGKVVVVPDVGKISLPAAPAEWLYKSSSFISYPIAIGNRKIGVLNLTDPADGESYNDADVKLLDAVMPSLAVMIDRANLKLQAGEFRQLSVTDALTGLLNRRYLEERLTEEIKRSNRHGFPMSFLMIDVDEFKSYNDGFGHPEGDKALQIVSACLKETLRGADVAARYGGEEFSILLPQTNGLEAEVIAERVRERVEMTAFPNRQVTVSIGIASCSLSLNSPKDLIAAADKALYEAKRKGRNNVQIYENLEDSFTAGKR